MFRDDADSRHPAAREEGERLVASSWVLAGLQGLAGRRTVRQKGKELQMRETIRPKDAAMCSGQALTNENWKISL